MQDIKTATTSPSERPKDLNDKGESSSLSHSSNNEQDDVFSFNDIKSSKEQRALIYQEIYSSWECSEDSTISASEIESIFMRLKVMFGFQRDSVRNIFDSFMRLLDSRASRTNPKQALKSLYSDYISGPNSNYKKWYNAASLHLDIFERNGEFPVYENKMGKGRDSSIGDNLELRWFKYMRDISDLDCIIQLALYQLCWGEANIIRYMPECLCFIFKCCCDHYYAASASPGSTSHTNFLEHVIDPLYDFYSSQLYDLKSERCCLREKDHASIIGYDDMNQLFWHENGLNRIKLIDGSTLMNLPPCERYEMLHNVIWSRAFEKTFKERRSWIGVFTNFNRIWVLHICIYWYYMVFNSPTLYTLDFRHYNDKRPKMQAKLTIMALAGVMASTIRLLSILAEYFLVPRTSPVVHAMLRRVIFTALVLTVNLFPSVFLFLTHSIDDESKWGLIVASSQFGVSVITSLYFSLVPSQHLFTSKASASGRNLASKFFTSSVPKLSSSQRFASINIWLMIWSCKMLESYFFLISSAKNSIKEITIMKVNFCKRDNILGSWICENNFKFLLGLIFLTEFVLFLLDTYLWFIIWNIIFSLYRSMFTGFSIFTPWKSIFSRLPGRIYKKLIPEETPINISKKFMVSQIWNSIVITMYRDHLISLEHVQKLIYKRQMGNKIGGLVLNEPFFFLAPEVQAIKSPVFERSEAQRRITFFAQSICAPLRASYSVKQMPSFSVLVPHFKEKILFSLQDIVRGRNQDSDNSLLEYLKSIYPLEWSCFVKDTKMMSEGLFSDAYGNTRIEMKNLSFEALGFGVSSPEYILRTRIWASLHSQTLYRTIDGFMNYAKALKLLHQVEAQKKYEYEEGDNIAQDSTSLLVSRKFKLIVSMQRFQKFNEDERKNQEFLLRAFPNLNIAYLEEETDKLSNKKLYYSVLIDGGCRISSNGSRIPKYRIKLSGNPILGDGKSDNQNHAVIFCRGEYIQLVDANQEHYLEECLKIRSLLSEFEETNLESEVCDSNKMSSTRSPVAFVGTREYIFSENIGVLGDIAAGKEQTFGTLFARSFGYLGAKLHYGHPDFVNYVFMTTRGGFSKGQRGLHLNEDIYAGMNAMMRGGRIKHSEFMQCGKGRDLGFGSVLNFNSKIGSGMGEQLLSREYFYLSSYLPADRFFSFYYIHPGFQFNNIFIFVSIFLILLFAVHISALKGSSVMCDTWKNQKFTDIRRPSGCFNLHYMLTWLDRCVLSIFVVIVISFLPLFIQDSTERGIRKSCTRLLKHFVSLSPLFEVFSCRIYAKALLNNLTYGGARYLGTNRQISTARNSFANIYSLFAPDSIYFGIKCLLLVFYCTLVMWRISLIYFWIVVFSLILCPFLYNPNQFNVFEFFNDYRDYLVWMFKNDKKNISTSWEAYSKVSRARIVGVNNLHREHDKGIFLPNFRPSKSNVLINNVLPQILSTIYLGFIYCFSNYHTRVREDVSVNVFLRIVMVSTGPILINAILLMVFFLVSIIVNFFNTSRWSFFPPVISGLLHLLALLNHIFHFEVLWYLQNWDLEITILGMTISILFQSVLLKLLLVTFISKEDEEFKSSLSWWTGDWNSPGKIRCYQASREYLCKVIELSNFSADIVIHHLLILLHLPILIIPGVRSLHYWMLFWFKNQGKQSFFQRSKKSEIKSVLFASFILFVFVGLFFSVIFLPLYFKVNNPEMLELSIPKFMKILAQPERVTVQKDHYNT